MTVGAHPLRVLLLCGGRSDEHEVSLASARSVLEAARGALDVVPRVIDRQGRVLDEEASYAALAAPGTPGSGSEGAARATTSPAATAADPPTAREAPSAEPIAGALERLRHAGIDVVFPLLHGPYGEDGSVQGLLKLLGLPFVGSDVLGSAVGMDKLVMKAVFTAHGLPQVAHGAVRRDAWARDPAAVAERLEPLPWPRFVKPANLGSSIGIARADDHDALAGAIDDALRFDRRVIVEEGVDGARELEVAVLGNDRPEASPVGEIRHGSGFYDYEAKYTDGRAELLIPAPVPPAVSERVRALAVRAFRAVDAAGLSRVDFFYREDDDRVWLNEINTMPGFTRTSMYPKLLEAHGVPYGALVRRLVELALEPR